MRSLPPRLGTFVFRLICTFRPELAADIVMSALHKQLLADARVRQSFLSVVVGEGEPT